jgi:colanic acid/amylovoran biosynthesis glycosyltransferase
VKIAFIIGIFPTISETFIINQVADLIDRGIDIEIISFMRGNVENISAKYFQYAMDKKTTYLDFPGNKFKRLVVSFPKIVKLFLYDPKLLCKALNFMKYGRKALSLQLIYYFDKFIGKKYDLYHCHFGPTAREFLSIKKIFSIEGKMITSFYGYDVSALLNDVPADYYDELKDESSLFFVMSENMKQRIIEKGFNKDKVVVLPVSIDLHSHPYMERTLKDGEPVRIVSVGRFVEKKGFDDLLRALNIVKQKSKRAFECVIIGDGFLKDDLVQLAERLTLGDVVKFKGYMKIEDIIKCFLERQLFVQPSKTARDGDME